MYGGSFSPCKNGLARRGLQQSNQMNCPEDDQTLPAVPKTGRQRQLSFAERSLKRPPLRIQHLPSWVHNPLLLPSPHPALLPYMLPIH
jgi:hypothetical protein